MEHSSQAEMRLGDLRGLISLAGSGIASLCCVLPLTVVLLGIGTGAFMATTMRYTSIFVPIGVVSVGVGVALHLRERRRCSQAGCRMANRTLQAILLGVSAIVVAMAVFFTVFPDTASQLLMRATDHSMKP